VRNLPSVPKLRKGQVSPISLWSQRELKFLGASELIGRQTAARSGPAPINSDTALRNSAVWAALTIRADLVSTFPIDTFRKDKASGLSLQVPNSPFFEMPGGPDVDWCEWSYSSQFDLDRLGNTMGLISAVDALGYPARVDLWPAAEVTVLVRDGDLWGFRYRGVEYPKDQVWHEKQNTVPGLHVGLSPIAYAAWTLGEYASIQQFALDWFGAGAVPSGHLKNTEKKIDPDLSREVKQEFKATVKAGDVFVSGADWEYSLIKAEMETTNWLEAKGAALVDVARYLRVPADLIDAALSGQSITYANMSQRNLQFLIINLNPGMVRREKTWSRRLTPKPRFVRMNRGALLQMDPETQARVLGQQVNDRLLAPSEARAIVDRLPFTPEQIDEFSALFGKPNSKPSNKEG
jgi:HK97 family phage portal protein